MEKIEVEVNEKIRIDVYLNNKYADLSRSYIQTLIEDGNILVNGEKMKTSYKVNQGDIIKINIPKPTPIKVKPEEIKLDIIYEDKDIIVINKPKRYGSASCCRKLRRDTGKRNLTFMQR